MSRLPALTGKQLVAVLQLHAGEMIGPGLLNSILRQVKLSRADLRRFL